MKAIVSTLLSLSITIVLVALPVRAQGGQSQDSDSLKTKIERLESTDVKSKSATVQLIYMRSLLRLYNQYSAALDQELNDLKNIQTAVGEADADTKKEVAARVQKLTQERGVTAEKIETLTADLRAAVTPGAPDEPSPAAVESARAESPRFEQVRFSRGGTPLAERAAAVPLPAPPASDPARTQPSVFTGALTPPLPQDGGGNTGGGGTGQSSGNVVQVDWASRSAGCPGTVPAAGTRYTFRVTNVNDVLVHFGSDSIRTHSYELNVNARRRSQNAPVGIFTGQSGERPLDNVCPAITAEKLARIRELVNGNRNLTRSPGDTGGRKITLAESLAAAFSITEVTNLLSALSQSSCAAAVAAFNNDPVIQWARRLQGTHTVDLSAVLDPDKNYEFTISETWNGGQTDGGRLRWDCGENDIFTLSVGPMISTLPARTYNQQRAPVPAGSSNVQNILTVENEKNINVLGAALLNYHFPRWRFMPGETSLGLSVGPVYTLGKAPDVSALGLFVGPSIGLTRSIFLTPGIHIGEFGDFPAGFGPGSVIPDQFGDLKPVKRRTAKFAFGITFKTNTFKKSSGNEGAGGNNAAGGGGSGSGSGGAQPTSGTGGQTTGGTTGTGGTRRP